jgi:hypothetical protein
MVDPPPGSLNASYLGELDALLQDLPEVRAALQRQQEGGGYEEVQVNLPPHELALLNSRVLWMLTRTLAALTREVDRLTVERDKQSTTHLP